MSHVHLSPKPPKHASTRTKGQLQVHRSIWQRIQLDEQQAIVVVPPDLSTFNREMTLANKSNQYNVLASDLIDFCSCSVEAALKFNPAGRSKLIIIRTYYIVSIYIYVYASSTGVSARFNAFGWSFSFCNALISCKQPSWQQAKV